MKFQYYWDYGFWPLSGHSSDITDPPTPGFGAISGDGAMSSAVDRIKAKAAQAKGVVPRVIAKVESGLDQIIGAEPELNTATDAAMAPHLSAIADTKTELDGIKSALDILSNGGPPLRGSTTAPPASTPVVHPVDHATGDPIKT